MSVNVHVNVRRCMAVDDCLQWSVHVSVKVVSECVGQCYARAYTLTLTSMHQHTEIRAANAISK